MSLNEQGGLRMRTSLVAALVALAVGADTAAAQEVTGLDVRQGDGFATLSWAPVAARPLRHRTHAGGRRRRGDGPTSDRRVWRPNRTLRRGADVRRRGLQPGRRYQWRVRATGQPFSAPCSPPRTRRGATRAYARSGRSPGRAVHQRRGDYEYTKALDEASERVRVVEICRTLLGRRSHVRDRLPEAAAHGARRGEGTAALVNCNVHGNEPSSREACMILAASSRSAVTAGPGTSSTTRPC